MTTISISSNIYLRKNVNNTEYATTSNFSSPTTISSWPATLSNTSNPSQNVNVYITNDLTLTATTQYFIMGSDNITFDGQYNKVIIDGVSDYPGLIKNGHTSSWTGKNNIIIQNLGVETVNGSTLAGNGGWIGQQFYNRDSSGCSLTNCYSTGPINGSASGGLIGSAGRGTLTNCYSTGEISGSSSSGLFGGVAVGTATNCYSTGQISGYRAGGICHYFVEALNCYSTGAISGQQSGGIYGYYGRGNATNCYSAGAISGSQAGGIYGPTSTGTATNCYAANGSWNDATASISLNSSTAPSYTNGSLTSQGTVWIDITPSSSNTPWLLAVYNSQLYNPNSITANNSSGSTGNGIITSGVEYQIIDVNNAAFNTSNFTIASSTGVITFTNLFDTNTIRVLRKIVGSTPPVGYQINTLSIVGSPAPPPPSPVPPPPIAPTLVYISHDKIPENISINSPVGVLRSLDDNVNNTFQYQLVSGEGSENNSSFTINNDILYTATTFNYSTKNTYSIRVRSTDSDGLSVENQISIYVVLPTAGSFETSAVVGFATAITLQGKNITNKSLVYQITKQPSFGSLTPSNTNGVYIYVPNSNKQDSIEYVVKEDTMTSLPASVMIWNYSQSDIENLSKTMGTITVDNISYGQMIWKVGTITTDKFIQSGSYSVIGTMRLQ